MGIRGETSCITCTKSVNKCKKIKKSVSSRGSFPPAFIYHLQPHQWKRSRRARPLRRRRASTGGLLGSNKYGAANHCPSSRLGSSYISNTPVSQQRSSTAHRDDYLTSSRESTCINQSISPH